MSISKAQTLVNFHYKTYAYISHTKGVERPRILPQDFAQRCERRNYWLENVAVSQT